MVILFAEDWACTFSLFVVWMRHPEAASVIPGLAYKWLPLGDFPLFDISKVKSSLVV